jgi:hypothetical protein
MLITSGLAWIEKINLLSHRTGGKLAQAAVRSGVKSRAEFETFALFDL